jgi:predicted permease
MTTEPSTLSGAARVIAGSVALLGAAAIIGGLVLLGVMLVRTLREGADPPTMIYFGAAAAVSLLVGGFCMHAVALAREYPSVASFRRLYGSFALLVGFTVRFGLIELDERTAAALWPALPDLGGLVGGVVLYLVLQRRLIPAGLPRRAAGGIHE